MRRLRRLTTPVVLCLALGCSNPSGPAALSLNAIQGQYIATHYLFQAAADTTRSQDQVTNGSQIIHLRINGRGFARTDTNIGNAVAPVAYDSGTIALNGDTLVFSSAIGGYPYEALAALTNRTLTLRDSLYLRALCPSLCVELVRTTLVLRRE